MGTLDGRILGGGAGIFGGFTMAGQFGGSGGGSCVTTGGRTSGGVTVGGGGGGLFIKVLFSVISEEYDSFSS